MNSNSKKTKDKYSIFSGERARAFLWLVLLGVIGGLFFGQLSSGIKLETSILKLLPKDDSDIATETAFEQFAEKNMRQLIFLVQSESESQVKASASQLAEKLQRNDVIESVSFLVSDEKQNAIAKFNFDYRYHLLSKADQKLLLSESFDEFSDNVIQQVYSPFSGKLLDLIKVDPLLLSYRYATSQNSNFAKESLLKLRDEHLIAEIDGVFYVLVTAKLSKHPFDRVVQQEIESLLSKINKTWDSQSDKVQLRKTGALFYASYAYTAAQSEISTIGVGSLILVITLVVAAFLSVRPLVLVSFAIAFGISSGFVFVHYFFESVHLLTIVFGASLIGVAVDYAFHYFSVGALEKSDQEKNSRLRKIFPAISLGLISSVIGYLSLLTTPFPGLQQMAVFCVFGLFGAYLTVVLLFPIIRLKNSTPKFLLFLCSNILKLAQSPRTVWLWRFLLFLPLVALIILFTRQVEQDDIRQFQTVDETLKQDEALIKKVVDAPAANQFYLVQGESVDSLLIHLEETTEYLDELVKNQVIEGYQSISQWLPSRKTQEYNYSLYKKLIMSRVYEPLTELNLVTQKQIHELQQTFIEDERKILTADLWLDSPIGNQLSHLWLGKIDQKYVAVVSLFGINQLDELKSFNENSVFVDKVSQISDLFSLYRHKTSQLLLIAIGLIFVILLVRYNLRKAFIISSAPIIAISTTVIGLSLLGVPMNLFNTLALFLVVGIGIDYGVFFAESKTANRDTLLAILLSAFTTIFSFGLLALSETGAIHAFGLTMLLGITTTFFISPITGHLVNDDTRKIRE